MPPRRRAAGALLRYLWGLLLVLGVLGAAQEGGARWSEPPLPSALQLGTDGGGAASPTQSSAEDAPASARYVNGPLRPHRRTCPPPRRLPRGLSPTPAPIAFPPPRALGERAAPMRWVGLAEREGRRCWKGPPTHGMGPWTPQLIVPGAHALISIHTGTTGSPRRRRRAWATPGPPRSPPQERPLHRPAPPRSDRRPPQRAWATPRRPPDPLQERPPAPPAHPLGSPRRSRPGPPQRPPPAPRGCRA